MKVTVVCEFDKAKALEAALAAVGADEFAFMREVLCNYVIELQKQTTKI